MPAIMPDYKELEDRILMNEEQQLRLQHELGRTKGAVQNIYRYGGELIEDVKRGKERVKQADEIIEGQEALREKQRAGLAKAREVRAENLKVEREQRAEEIKKQRQEQAKKMREAKAKKQLEREQEEKEEPKKKSAKEPKAKEPKAKGKGKK